MPASPYSSVQKAREQLAARLVEIRKDAGINSRELARRLGWYESKVASLRLAEGAYVEWRRMERAGLRAAQESVLPL